MEKKFITAVSMEMTEEQYEREFKVLLENMGCKNPYHEREGRNVLCNNWGPKLGQLGWCEDTGLWNTEKGYFIDRYNPELFLALAAMTEGPGWIVGEWLKYGEEFFQALQTNRGNDCEHGRAEPGCVSYNKPTKEELIDYFTGKKVDQKEIIGYKVPYPIFTHSDTPLSEGDIVYPCQHRKTSAFYADLEASRTTSYSRHLPAEIVETWEPVYKPTEVTIDMGAFTVVVKDGKAFHKNDNITDFVKGLCDRYNFSLEDAVGGYRYTLSEITFSKTGCQKQTTTLSQWIKVKEVIDKQSKTK